MARAEHFAGVMMSFGGKYKEAGKAMLEQIRAHRVHDATLHSNSLSAANE